MINLFQLLYTIFNLIFKAVKPGGIRSIIAEDVCLRQQLIILSRNKKRCPNLSNSDRLIFGFFSQYINSIRLPRLAIAIKPTTLIKLHKIFISRKYRLLFSKKNLNKPGRNGPSQEIIDLILKYKTLNPRFGYLRIAMQVSSQFRINVMNHFILGRRSHFISQ